MIKSILFPITYECNLSCAFCCSRNCERTIDINESLKYLQKKKRAEWVYITGGEPFLFLQLCDVCDSLKGSGYKVGVTTNGTIFKPAISLHIDRLGVSLDGDHEYHDKYRGDGVFEKAINLLRASKNNCETVIMSTVFSDNIEALRRLRLIVEKFDPTYWQIQRDVNDATIVIPRDLR